MSPAIGGRRKYALGTQQSVVTANILQHDAFQNETLLLNDLEELDLETLQGVDGLKAIRVGVRIEDVSSVSLSMNKFEKSI